MKMIVEKQMECRLAGETEVLRENLPQRHFCPSQNPTLSDPGLNPGRRGGKPVTNRLSCGAASSSQTYCLLILHPHPLQKLGALKPVLRVGNYMFSPHVIKHLKYTFLEGTNSTH
jgi:hypothetical protein